MHPTVARPPVTRHELLTELVSQAVGDDRWLTAAVSLDALENDGELARSVLLEAAERLATSAKTADPADLTWAVRKAALRSAAPGPALPGNHEPPEGAACRATEQDDGRARPTAGPQPARPAAAAAALGSLRRGPELDLGALVDALGFMEVTETR
ncbi:hypothetical protein C5F59_007270 [Streptomyces sp. QL37]|uniref:hypothetical protein n=1 Tax=Streptomyces sp. QL37 TaxID=2093747 RepID=UPI000CF23087|nr:hypothetical protein [Streptomyces sp. QL37]PPQ56495.1 hypothetical protein C5F59_07345 [Streptomyces sp. QL37]